MSVRNQFGMSCGSHSLYLFMTLSLSMMDMFELIDAILFFNSISNLVLPFGVPKFSTSNEGGLGDQRYNLVYYYLYSPKIRRGTTCRMLSGF